VKEAASRYFCWGEARSWVYQTSWGPAICICERENSRLYSFDSGFWRGGGHRKFTNILNRGPVKILLSLKTTILRLRLYYYYCVLRYCYYHHLLVNSFNK
jgi:hypothetical protein